VDDKRMNVGYTPVERGMDLRKELREVILRYNRCDYGLYYYAKRRFRRQMQAMDGGGGGGGERYSIP